jgi:hypothetical protein
VCLKRFESLKGELFHGFSLSADILLNAAVPVQPVAVPVVSPELLPSSVVFAPIDTLLPDYATEQQDLEAQQVVDAAELESWAYTINVFRDYTESDWDMMAGQAEMHWPF